jgi:hypothetical protein
MCDCDCELPKGQKWAQIKTEALREAEGIVRGLCDRRWGKLKAAGVIGPFTAFSYAADRLAARMLEVERGGE